LGEFSPIGQHFETYRSGLIFGATLSHGKSNVLILTKMVWDTFWVSFSQTHLVTLSLGDNFTPGRQLS
jgi:hypothetical protein